MGFDSEVKGQKIELKRFPLLIVFWISTSGF